MHILYLVPYAPTPIRTRPYNLLRGLARRGHNLTLATLWENDEERDDLRRWQEMGVTVLAAPLGRARKLLNVATALPSSIPLQASFCWQPCLARMVESELARQPYDIIHVEHLRGARYGIYLKSVLGPRSSVPLVWDSVDCISHLFEQAAHSSASISGRLMTHFELPRTRQYEAWLISQFEHVLVTSAVDKQALERLNVPTFQRSNVAPITVLPNGVDLEYFQPGTCERRPASIVFSGKMSYHANATAVLRFAEQVLPLIWRQHPEATFTIAGHNPPAEVRKLARDARIVVTGSVPDIRPFLQQASVAVAPMVYGAGIQNKVLEAMACATPVVATAQAVAALTVQADEHLLVAETAHGLADAVIRLLNDGELQQRIGWAGRRHVEEHHDWTNIAASLESIYRDVVAGQGDISNEGNG